MKSSFQPGEMNRREFAKVSSIAGMGLMAAVGTAGRVSAAGNTVKMFKDLNCGMIGVKADQFQAVRYAAEYGFDSVSTSAQALEGMSADQLSQLLDLMKEKSIIFGVAGLPVEFRRDENRFKEDIVLLPDRAELLKRVGVNRISTWILPGNNELTYLENFEQHRRRLAEAARILKENRIRLGLEFVGPRTLMNRFRYPFVHTQQEMMELAHAIGTGNVGLLLDAWHWYTSHGTVEELKELSNEDVVQLHVNDAPAGIPVDEQIDNQREVPLATGVINMEGFINALADIGFDGPVTCEPFNQELNKMEDEAALEKVSKAFRRLFAMINA